MLLNRNQFVLTLHVRHNLNKSGNMQWSDTIRKYILIFIFNNKFNNKKLSMTVVIMTCCSAWIDLKNATFLLIIYICVINLFTPKRGSKVEMY